MHRTTPAPRLDPHGWIDDQRLAGDKRGNVFADILAESMRVRAERQGWDSASIERRQQRIADIKREAAQVDAQTEAVVVPPEPAPVQSFSEMVDRWKQG